jgi:hypothetical protein
LWAGGDKSGILSVKNLYKALAEIFWHHTIKGWRYKLWKWNVALKIKLFFWLILENKVLTWENLVSKGWEGPSFCILCARGPETVNHLFIHCLFTRQVWLLISGVLKLFLFWDGLSVEGCFDFGLRRTRLWLSCQPLFVGIFGWSVIRRCLIMGQFPLMLWFLNP